MPTPQPSPRRPSRVGGAMNDPTVVEVLRVEEPARAGRRHVVVRWSDGSSGRALSYFADEILISEATWSAGRPPSFAPCTSRATASTCSAATDARTGRRSRTAARRRRTAAARGHLPAAAVSLGGTAGRAVNSVSASRRQPDDEAP